MKKIVSTLGALALTATIANADFIRIEGGVGGWVYSPDSANTMTYTDNSITGTYTTDGKGQTGAYAWALVKHPVPVIPNLRLEYVDVKEDGKVSGSFADFTAPANSAASVNFKQYDIIPYYNILDNTFWITLDLGLDVKILDATVKAKGVNVNGIGTGDYTDSSIVPIPLGYARARVEVPATGFGVEGDVKYITYNGSTVSDIRIKADYTFDFAVVDPGIEIGYRMQNFDLKSDDDKTKTALKYSGVYVGLMVRF